MSDSEVFLGTLAAITKFHNPTVTKPSKKLQISNDEIDEYKFYFDFFSQKLAFVTSEGQIKIYEIIHKEGNPEQIFHNQFQAHKSNIKSLSWQTPKMESLIATCGDDGFIKIFQETGKLWREIWQFQNQKLQPFTVIWIQDEPQLVIAYTNGLIEIREGPQYKVTFSNQLYDLQCVDLDVQKLDESFFITSSGIDVREEDPFLKFSIIHENSLKTIFDEQVSLEKIQLATYLQNGQIKFAGVYSGNVVVILIFEIEESLKEITGNIKTQQIQMDSSVTKLQWSIFGNKIQIYTHNIVREFQQNTNSDFVPI